MKRSHAAALAVAGWYLMVPLTLAGLDDAIGVLA